MMRQTYDEALVVTHDEALVVTHEHKLIIIRYIWAYELISRYMWRRTHVSCGQ